MEEISKEYYKTKLQEFASIVDNIDLPVNELTRIKSNYEDTLTQVVGTLQAVVNKLESNRTLQSQDLARFRNIKMKVDSIKAIIERELRAL